MKISRSGRAVSYTRGGALFKLIAFLVLFGGVLTAAWIFGMPPLLTSVLSKRTGFNVKVTQMSLNPFTSKVDMEGLVVTNPPTYPRSDFIEVRSFHANGVFSTLFSERPELDYAIVDVAQISVVQSTDGTVNATLFQDRMFGPKDRPLEDDPKNTAAKGKDATKKKEERIPATAPATPFLIKHLELKIDRLVLADYTFRTVTVKEYDLNFTHTYENVTDPNQLISEARVKGLSSVGAAIGGLIPGGLGKVMASATKAPEAGKGPAKKARESVRSMIDALEQTSKP